MLPSLSPLQRTKQKTEWQGIYHTRVPDLFDFETYLTDNFKAIEDGTIIADGDDSNIRAGCMPPLLTMKVGMSSRTSMESYFHYRVTGENGSYTTTTGNDRIADGHVSIKHTDDGQEVNLEGTIYTPPTKDITHFYINPVYQSESGEIYVVSGSGISFDSDGSEGGAFTQTIDAITTVTENGETESFSTSVKISIAVKSAPESHSILEFGADGVMISNDAYNPGDLPDTITPHHNCAYIILESTSGKNVTRTLYQKEDSFIETFYPGDDSILRIQQTSLEWID